MSTPAKLHLFEGYGVELEYMIVDAQSLRVMPIADKLIYQEAGAYVSDVEFGAIAWSNELVLHVIELKTNGPAGNLHNLPNLFQGHVIKINAVLAKYGATLLPTGMHPFMNPYTDTQLWPHEYNAVYEAYNQIFDCRGHGWSNLQSTHLNLPFANDEEFARLRAAIRLLLPIIPALSASSPVMDGKITGLTDTRLEVYRKNQARIPVIVGKVIPEAVFTKAEYESKILQNIYQAIAPYDPQGILQDEFLNSRGAIARFDRSAIEIRIIDNQECSLADIAILTAITEVLKLLTAEKWSNLGSQKNWHEDDLAAIFLEVVQHGQKAVIHNLTYLRMFGYESATPCTVRELWQYLVGEVQEAYPISPTISSYLQTILKEGNLSERISAALGVNPTSAIIEAIYRQLALCLQTGKPFQPEP